MDAKSISKRLKLKGLQRLRWYCQMCEKQCRDENGFKNHCTTENHLRQMERFSSNTKEFTERFSGEFERQFIDCLSRYHIKRMGANYVYNEMIQDKQHVHMNSTKWGSLAQFVKHLGETGKCEVDQDEEDERWYVRWIDPALQQREREEARREADRAKRQRRAEEGVVRQVAELQQQQEEEGEGEEEEEALLLPTSTRLVLAPTAASTAASAGKPRLDIFKEEEEEEEVQPSVQEEEEEARAAVGWLMPNLVVRIASKKVGGKELVDCKAVVSAVWEAGTVCDLILLKTGQEIVNVPQSRLETCVPSGKKKHKHTSMVVVCGTALRGRLGTVLAISARDGTCTVQLREGGGASSVTLPLDHVCKLFNEDEEEEGEE